MKQKWIAIIGSPRRGKNTDLLVDYIASGLTFKDIDVEMFHLDQKRISVCTNCELCIERGACHINDEITVILEEMKKADGFILASPSYNYNVSAQMKVLLDRSFSLNDYSGDRWKSRLKSGKKAIIAGTCKGDTSDSMGYTIEAMRKCIDELGVEVVDMIEYFDTKNYPVAENKTIRETIEQRIRGKVLI